MKTYTIQELSHMFQLPASTLRYYEESGLLTKVGRTPAGKRVYEECHVNRLKTICCFKRAGMTISQLQAFFSYESNESEHIDDIVSLLEQQKSSMLTQMEDFKLAYNHLLRKVHYYGEKQKCLNNGKPLPEWDAYRNMDFSDENPFQP